GMGRGIRRPWANAATLSWRQCSTRAGSALSAIARPHRYRHRYARPYRILRGGRDALRRWERSLPHFATAKIKDFSRTNQARLKDPRLRGRQSCRSENPARIRAAIERRHRTQEPFVWGALPGRLHNGTDHWISVWTSGLRHIPRDLPLRRRLRF